jgi:hypothetical protein
MIFHGRLVSFGIFFGKNFDGVGGISIQTLPTRIQEYTFPRKTSLKK